MRRCATSNCSKRRSASRGTGIVSPLARRTADGSGGVQRDGCLSDGNDHPVHQDHGGSETLTRLLTFIRYSGALSSC